MKLEIFHSFYNSASPAIKRPDDIVSKLNNNGKLFLLNGNFYGKNNVQFDAETLTSTITKSMSFLLRLEDYSSLQTFRILKID